MKPSYIYFDLDNTLLDHASAEAKAQQITYKKYPELQKINMDEWLETYAEVNHNLWVRYQDDEIDRHQLHFSRFHDSMKELGLSTADSEEIGKFYIKNYRDFWDWVGGARETLKMASEKYEVGIITNGFKETQEIKFDKLSLGDYCNCMIISEELGQLKPHPIVFDHATEVAGVDRDKILYVGDSYSSDIVGGNNAGWQTAWYTGMVTKNGEEDIADFEFDNFSDLNSYLDL